MSELDFSNIKNFITLNYEQATSYGVGELYFIADTDSNKDLPVQSIGYAGQIYGCNLTNTVAEAGLNTISTYGHSCLGVVQLDASNYLIISPHNTSVRWDGTTSGYSWSQAYSDSIAVTNYSPTTRCPTYVYNNDDSVTEEYVVFSTFSNFYSYTKRSWDSFLDLISNLMSSQTNIDNLFLGNFFKPNGPEMPFWVMPSDGNPPFTFPILSGNQARFQHYSDQLGKVTISTNIPIFLLNNEENFEAFQNYYISGDSSALAYAWDGRTELVNPKNLYYHIKYRTESRDQYGQNPTYSEWVDKYIVWEETEKNAICGYQDSTEPLSFNLVGYNGIACRVSDDGGETWTEYASAPVDYQSCIWWQGQLADGSGYVRYSTRSRNINIFKDQANANQYIATGDNEEEAIDPEVTNPAVDRDPDFGTKEYTTTLSTPYMTNNTRHAYYMTASNVAALKAAIFADSATMTTIVDGTQFWASSHLDCITDCCFYPVDLVSLSSTAVSRSTFVMGAWVNNFSSSFYEEMGCPGWLDCGSVNYNSVWDDIRDYEPYSELFIYLPYAGGFHRLNIDKYINTSVNIKYAIDIESGRCTAFLFADGILRDYFEGDMGVHMRFSSPDAQQDQLATLQNVSKQVSALTGGVSSAVGGAIGEPTKEDFAGAVASGNMGGIVARQAGGALAGAVETVSHTGLQMFNGNTAVPEFSSGGITPTIAQYAPQYPFMVVATRKTVRPENELNLVGYPSGASGTVGSFSGFLKASAVKLRGLSGATKTELDMITRALRQGIYI